MFERSNNWYYTKEEKKKIKDCILPICKKWREKEDDDTIDYVMAQPSDIIVHNGKGAINKSKFINKINFRVRKDWISVSPTVRTDTLYLNEEFLTELKTALRELE